VVNRATSASNGLRRPSVARQGSVPRPGGMLLESKRGVLARAASELHRGPAHYLAATMMLLRLCDHSFDKSPRRARLFLRQCIQLAGDALERVRSSITLLQYPGSRAGLMACLTGVADELRQSGGPEIRLQLRDPGPLPETVEDALAIVGCEALSNAVRHAGARVIIARVFRKDDTAAVVISDDGRGFDYRDVLRRGAAGSGLGLMRRQMRAVRGTLRIERQPDGGTVVVAAVPIAMAPASAVEAVPLMRTEYTDKQG
jgi:signal transduction histidine kinase